MKKLLLSFLLLLGLQACGQAGPLYHPAEEAPIIIEDNETE